MVVAGRWGWCKGGCGSGVEAQRDTVVGPGTAMEFRQGRW